MKQFFMGILLLGISLAFPQTYKKLPSQHTLGVESRALESIVSVYFHNSDVSVVPILLDDNTLIYNVWLNFLQFPYISGDFYQQMRELQKRLEVLQQKARQLYKKSDSLARQLGVGHQELNDKSISETSTPGRVALTGVPDSMRAYRELKNVMKKMDSISVKFLSLYVDPSNQLPPQAEIFLFFHIGSVMGWNLQSTAPSIAIYRLPKSTILKYRQGKISYSQLFRLVEHVPQKRFPNAVDVQVFAQILPSALSKSVKIHDYRFSMVKVLPFYISGKGLFFVVGSGFLQVYPPSSTLTITPSPNSRKDEAKEWLQGFVPQFLSILRLYGLALSEIPKKEKLVFVFYSWGIGGMPGLKYFWILVPVNQFKAFRAGHISFTQFTKQVKVIYF